LSDAEYRELQTALGNRPNAGAVFVAGGGISVKEELFKELVATVREGGAILRGEIAPSRKFVVDHTDVRRIRTNYRLSQGQFAALLGISVATLQNWEQGRRLPKGAARVLLQVAAKHPETVWDVVKPGVTQNRTKAGMRVARAARSSKALQV
jgi:putative transcriptional regulator